MFVSEVHTISVLSQMEGKKVIYTFVFVYFQHIFFFQQKKKKNKHESYPGTDPVDFRFLRLLIFFTKFQVNSRSHSSG